MSPRREQSRLFLAAEWLVKPPLQETLSRLRIGHMRPARDGYIVGLHDPRRPAMNRFSSLTIALCAALVASSAWAQDTTTSASAKNNDLRQLDVLVVTGATLDGNTQRWALQAGAAAKSGENNDVREIDAVIVTGATLDGDTQRWADDN
jgi:hypothetical protein